jgi:integrase
VPKLAETQVTETTVKSAKPREHRYEVRDAALTGFMLRVSPSGRKSFYVQLERGKKRRIGNAKVMTLTRARRLAIDMLDRHDAGEEIESVRSQKPTLRKFLTETYKPWAEQNLKNGQLNIKRLKSCCGPLLKIRIDRISEIQIERWKSNRLKQGLEPSTVKRDLGELKAALTRAAKWGYAAENPSKGVTVSVETHHRVRYLSDSERNNLMSALKDRDKRMRVARESANVFRIDRGYETKPSLGEYADYLTPIILLVINTGLRRSEAFTLRWSQVRLIGTPQLAVLAAHAKSKKTRYIPLNKSAVSTLETWSMQYGLEGLVFPNMNGGQLKSIKTAWGKLMKDAKIEDFRFHDLRHDFASQLAMKGVDLYRVKELLGHGSIEITQRYAHLAPHTLAEAVEVLV